MAAAAISVFSYIYTNQDKILGWVIEEMNGNLRAEIKVESYELDLFSQFPKVAIKFKNVACLEVIPEPENNLFSFQNVFINLNIWDILQKDYRIKSIKFQDGDLNIKELRNGRNNYTFWKTSNDTSSTSIELEDVSFIRTHFTFYDSDSHLQIESFIEDFFLTGSLWKDVFNASLDLNSDRFNLISDDIDLIQNSKLRINTLFKVESKEILFENASCQINDLILNVNGSIIGNNNQWNISGENLRLDELTAAIPEYWFPTKNDLELKGSTALSMQIISDPSGINIESDIDITKASYTNKESNLEINDLSLKAHFSNGEKRNITSSKLSIDNAKGKTKTGSFFWDVDISNFESPSILINGTLAIDMEELMQIARPGIFEKAGGRIETEFTATNSYKNFQEVQSMALDQARFSGKLSVNRGYLKFTDSNFELENLETEVVLNGRNIDISRLSITSGQNIFEATGSIDNVLYFSEERPTPVLNVDIKSSFIDIKEISSWQFGNSESSSSEMPFDINSQIEVDKFVWDDFTGNQLKGEVNAYRNFIEGSKILFNSNKGRTSGRFRVDSKLRNLKLESEIKNVEINSLFQEFHSFGQKDLTEQNIFGNLNSEIQLNMEFNEKWEVIPDRIELMSAVRVSNGKLINYKPLESLKEYAVEENLKNVQFSNLENRIEIRNSKIYIPQMNISSNALNLELEGIHYFDSRIDYSIKMQMSKVLFGEKNKKTGYDDWIEISDREDQPHIWINVGCTVDDPCASIDTEMMNRDIKNEWKDQKNDLKNILKKDEVKKNDESEYIFEWNEEPDTSKGIPF